MLRSRVSWLIDGVLLGTVRQWSKSLRYFFDRLCFPRDANGSSQDFGEEEIGSQVTLEISRITSQRQYFGGFGERHHDANKQDPVLEFGINRRIGEAVNRGLMRKLALEMKRAIIRNEPRLLEPRVECVSRSAGFTGLSFIVSGKLSVGSQIQAYRRRFNANGDI